MASTKRNGGVQTRKPSLGPTGKAPVKKVVGGAASEPSAARGGGDASLTTGEKAAGTAGESSWRKCSDGTSFKEKCKAWYKAEFKKSNFGLDYEEPRVFCTPETNQHLPIFLVYRFVAVLAGCSVLVIGGIDIRSLHWFTYYTSWAFFMLTIDAILKLSSGGYHYWKVEKKRTELWKLKAERGRGAYLPEAKEPLYKKLPVFYKVVWVWHNIAYASAPTSTILFWGAYYLSSMNIGFLFICMNILNTIYVALDVFVVAVPMRLFHVIHPIIAAVTWCVFLVLYWALGGTDPEGLPNLYHGLRFDSPDVATYIWLPALVILCLPAFHTGLYFLSMLRVFLYDKCKVNRDKSLEPSDSFIEDSDDSDMEDPEVVTIDIGDTNTLRGGAKGKGPGNKKGIVTPMTKK